MFFERITDQIMYFANGKDKNNIALADSSKCIDYKKCADMIRAGSDMLVKHKKKEKVLIGIRLEKSVDWALSILSCLHSNVCFYMLNPQSTYDELIQELNFLNITGLICDYQTKKLLNIAGYSFCAESFLEENELIIFNGANKAVSFFNIPESSIYINSTSGSTGRKKFAFVTHKNLMVNSMSVISHYHLDNTCRFACLFPEEMHPHESLFRPLYVGGTAILIPRQQPHLACKLLKKYNVTHLMATPTQVCMLLPFMKGMKFSDLVMVECTGGRLSEGLYQKIEQTLLAPIRSYGSTEATGVFLSTFASSINRDNFLGRCHPFYSAMLTSENELVLKSEAVVGVLLNSAGGAEYLDGEYATEDILFKEEDNYLFRCRKKHIMKVAGEYVYPDIIEQHLSRHPDVKEAVVIPGKDDERGEVPIAFVVLNDSKVVTEQELLIYCSLALNSYEVPKRILIIESIPMTCNGKVDYQALQQRVAKN